MVVETRRFERVFVDNGTFLREVRRRFPIFLIYYPGCGNDTASLEGTFKKKEIIYGDLTRKVGLDRQFVEGNYSNRLFPDETFDAVFYQDNHAGMDEFRTIAKTLKKGGILIHSNLGCELDFPASEIATLSDFQRVHLPIENPYYTVFQKIPGVESI